MEFNVADVVISLNGRDKGKRFIIVEKDDIYSLLTDGKGRKLEKPKRKKNKHIKADGVIVAWLAEKLIAGNKITNKEIRKALAVYAVSKEGGDA